MKLLVLLLLTVLTREYGDRWHKAGILEKKQNVFDDFIAAAEYLIENKYTNPKRWEMYAILWRIIGVVLDGSLHLIN